MCTVNYLETESFCLSPRIGVDSMWAEQFALLEVDLDSVSQSVSHYQVEFRSARIVAESCASLSCSPPLQIVSLGLEVLREVLFHIDPSQRSAWL